GRIAELAGEDHGSAIAVEHQRGDGVASLEAQAAHRTDHAAIATPVADGGLVDLEEAVEDPAFLMHDDVTHARLSWPRDALDPFNFDVDLDYRDVSKAMRSCRRIQASVYFGD